MVSLAIAGTAGAVGALAYHFIEEIFNDIAIAGRR
jgi:hypothetical protein